MEFQYMSDLHIEKGNIINITPKAPYLILAGDIGDPKTDLYINFLKYVSRLFQRVFLIAGNHEYYDSDITTTDILIRKLVKPLKNIIFLQNEAYHFPDRNLSIFGTTLWSRINLSDAYMIQCLIADYRKIKGFDIQTCIKLHEDAIKAFKWYNEERFPNRNWICITHHLPLTSLTDVKYKDSILNSAYASNVECFKDNNILAVVYGHTHSKNISGKYYCNPIGYPDENKIWDLEACFKITC
jgi:predicted phosphodiesterase